ncbi:MAG: hypothetical protein RL329_3936 [Bacteroidota bacterium]
MNYKWMVGKIRQYLLMFKQISLIFNIRKDA